MEELARAAIKLYYDGKVSQEPLCEVVTKLPRPKANARRNVNEL
jgi:hypothetical protein